MSRTFYIALASLFLANGIDAVAQQNLFLRSFATDSLGNRSASSVYFNPSGMIEHFSKNQVAIQENGLPARIISVTCSASTELAEVSSVLTIDVSGSMKFGGPNIELAKEAAKAWVGALHDESEAAVLSFDHSVILQSDLTTDKERLRTAISRLRPRGGTSYEKGFLDSTMGALKLASSGRHKRVVVFLTDGFGDVSADSVINRALRDSITIYCVTLGLNMPGVLQRISEATGGLWFDNVTTIEQATQAYQRIFADATGNNGCTIVWEPPIQCFPTSTVQAQVKGAVYKLDLPVPEQRRGGMQSSAASVHFAKADTSTKYVVIRNRNATSVVTEITNSRPDVFAVSGVQTPVTIKPNDSIRIEVKCLKLDSQFVVAQLTLGASPCPAPSIYMSAGDPSSPPSRPTLRVVSPNGGERIPIRSYYELRWEGLPPSVPVKVEVSIDAGRSWAVIDENKRGLEQSWHTGHTASDSCLLRVTHVKPQTSAHTPLFSLVNAQYSDVAFTNDGNFLATGETALLVGSASKQPPATIWDGKSGKKLLQLGQGSGVEFSSDSRYLLTWGRDSVAYYTMPNGKQLWRVPVRTIPAMCVVSKNGTTVLVGGGENDQTIVIDATTGMIRDTLARKFNSIHWADISADASTVAVCDRDSTISVFSLTTTSPTRYIIEKGVSVYYRAMFTPDGKRLVTTDGLGTAKLWDVNTLTNPIILTTRAYRNDNTYIGFTPDGNRVAMETNTNETVVIDLATGTPVVSIKRLQEPGGASDATILADNHTLLLSTLSFATAFDAQTGVQILRVTRGFGQPAAPANGGRMAVINANMVIDVYSLESPVLQQDVSDNYWVLYHAVASLQPVRLRQCAVGQSVDSIVVGALVNRGKNPVTVRGLRIEGLQAADFGINAPKEILLAPGETFPITYSFHPKAVGERAALIVAETSSGLINARISGRCMGGIVKAGAESRDLGLVPIGKRIVVPVSNMLRNEGLDKVWVLSMKLVEGNDPAFTLLDTAAFSLEPGEEHSFEVGITATAQGMVSTQIEFTVQGIAEPIEATIYAHADSNSLYIASDPTTFRTIILPSAIVPPAGTFTTGVYDVLGISLGYSITDHIAVLAGGVLPFKRSWLGATGYQASYNTSWSVGAKVGYSLGNDWIVGGGYQFGQSIYDQEPTVATDSKITFNALWGSAGYGNDNSRLNLYLGYAFKHHVTLADGEFQADATILGIGYDVTVAPNWKVCFESFFMRTMDFVPATLTGRYFRENDAFEFGFSYIGFSPNDKAGNGWPVVPILSWVKRW